MAGPAAALGRATTDSGRQHAVVAGRVPSLGEVVAPAGPYRLASVLLLCVVASVVIGAGVALAGPLLLVIGLVALFVGIALLTNPMYLLWCALAVIALLPFATIPVDIGVTPTFLEICIAGAFAVALFGQGGKSRAVLLVSPVGWLLLLFMGLALASFVSGISHARPTVTSLRRFADMLLSLSLFYLVLNALGEERELGRTYHILLGLGAVAAFVGIVLYFLPATFSERLLNALSRVGYPGGSVLRYIEDDPSQALRAIGTSVDPNVFGGLLAFMGGLVAPQLFVRRRTVVMLAYWAVAGVIGLALLLTFSRGSMFGLVVALGTLGLVRHRQILWLLAAGAVLVFILPPTRGYVEHALAGLQGQDLATQMRFGEYKDAFLLIGRYPWFGVGFTGAPDVDIYLGVSSVYLLVAEEMGLVGLVTFLAAGATFFGYVHPAARLAQGKDSAQEALILGAETAVLAGLVAGILDHYLFNLTFPHAAALLWVTIAVGVAAARLAKERFASGVPAG
ncbi:MAG: O-antigen ligase family protein [Anaerolineae bacterium]